MILNNLVAGGHGCFYFFKGSHLPKSLGNPGLNSKVKVMPLIKILIFYLTSKKHVKENIF